MVCHLGHMLKSCRDKNDLTYMEMMIQDFNSLRKTTTKISKESK